MIAIQSWGLPLSESVDSFFVGEGLSALWSLFLHLLFTSFSMVSVVAEQWLLDSEPQPLVTKLSDNSSIQPSSSK